MRFIPIWLAASMIVSAGAVASDDASLAAGLKVRYQVIANGLTSECPAVFKGDTCFRASLSFTNPVDTAPGEPFSIWFSHMEPIRQADSPDFTVTHVNGDLYRIDPKPGSMGFTAGVARTLTLWGTGSHLSEYYVMPNYYVVDASGQATVIASTEPVIDPETGIEHLPHVAPFDNPATQFKRSPDDATVRPTPATDHAANIAISYPADASASLIPTPRSVARQDGTLDLARGLQVKADTAARTAAAVGLARLALLGVKESADGFSASLTLDPKGEMAGGGYRLVIAKDGISATAKDGEGLQNALMSLAGLIHADSAVVPLMTIEDSPRFGFRGVHLDLARNFNSRDFILALLDQMAAYKLNKLTLQLADDEGWRIEIAGLPELTEIGSKRCHDPEESRCLLPQLGSGPAGTSGVNGFLSGADYRGIVRAAAARHIEVIPFIDMPGHARAAIRAMEARYRRLAANGDMAGANEYRLADPADKTVYDSVQHYNDNTINVCLPSSEAFVTKLVDELAALHAAAGQPLTHFHLGGDETPGAWVKSPACKAFLEAHPGDGGAAHLGARFIERVSHMLAARGIKPAGWGDGLADTDAARMPDSVAAFAWAPLFWGGAENAHILANRNWDLIISTPDAGYLDAPYAADPMERGYDWASRHTSTRKVFDFMPENLPAHAEIWEDSSGQKPAIEDSEPLRAGIRAKGMQAQLWSETVRSNDQAAYMLFPRLLAFAERAWHRGDWEVPYVPGKAYSPETHALTDAAKTARAADWARFAALLGHRELAKLDLAAIPYRVPTVGAVMAAGHLQASTPYPGLAIEMRQAGGDWQAYAPGREVTGAIEIRARSADGKRPGRAVTVPAE